MSIEVKNLNYIYNEDTPFSKIALNDVSFKVETGDFVGIIGHTGSGKSTLIQMLNGLIAPTSGEVLIDGVNINGENVNKKEVRQKVGLVFQYPEYQLFELTVLKDVAYGPNNMGLDEKEVSERVEDALKSVGLPQHLWEQPPFQLSGGQKRRVAIAGVIAMKPTILILDEPTAGLDPKGRDELFMQLKTMHKELGITIVLISHSMEDVAKYVNKLIVLDGGKLKYNDTPREVFKNVNHLESIGLAPPQIKYIVNGLRQNGINISDEVLTVEEATKEIIKYLGGEPVC